MRITIIQTDIVWKNAEENRKQAEKAIKEAPLSDLYVLPEMFTTGFCTQPEDIAEEFQTANGKQPPSLQWMIRIAEEMDCAIAGSIIVKEKADTDDSEDRKGCCNSKKAYYNYFNRLFFVYPDHTYCYYDKRHLFTYGEEDKHYTCGRNRMIAGFRGVRILLQICYDLRFPVWSRNKGDYDMAIYVASWPTSRIHVWNTLLAARAMENQCYVAGVNRVGQDPVCEYCGNSRIISPYGKTIGECGSGSVHTATAEIDMEKLNAFRHKFPVLDDRDDFTVDKI
ncbi:MAG: nitrilase family protein [Bacteroides sp.]|nr:hypothetical protein [Roseburia sp.]MCM1347004.1 nitrilase family protein [Bacteroides sp.]MCM1421566.1 nitrilase family protein [Bacteroides sp.]